MSGGEGVKSPKVSSGKIVRKLKKASRDNGFCQLSSLGKDTKKTEFQKQWRKPPEDMVMAGKILWGEGSDAQILFCRQWMAERQNKKELAKRDCFH